MEKPNDLLETSDTYFSMIWYKSVVWSVHDQRKMIQKDKKPAAADVFLCKRNILIFDLLYIWD